MLKIKTGQTPNLPWWRLQKMSDEEIKKFNNSFMMIEGLPESVGTKEVAFQNPVILDITADVNGRVVQWNGEVWLLYDSEEAIQFRNKCLKEFRERRNHLELLERYIWNRAIEAAASKADEAGYEPIAEVIRDLKK